MAHEYNPFRTLVVKSDSGENNKITEFNTDEIDVDLNNPLFIECQPSYDGTVNLIINDDKNPPRILNSRFTRLENNRYKIINRNQIHQTNLYDQSMIDRQTRLFRNINSIPKFDLVGISTFGQLMGGNYHFYLKLADNDYNKTDIVSESGVVSIFKGTINKPSTNSGTLEDERTDKSVTMRITNIDLSFSKYYIYYTRDFCDANGLRKTLSYMLTKPFDIKNTEEVFTINGYEDVEEVSEEELNINYHIVTNVKTQSQVQNMLFFGNVEEVNVDIVNLQNLSYFIDVSLCRQKDSIGWLDSTYKQKEAVNGDDLSQCEYYNPKNIYYNLGYWPDEIYRLGVVYIMNDDTLSPVFNLRGCSFNSVCTDDVSFDQNNNNLLGAGRTKTTIHPLKSDGSYDLDIVNKLERDTFLSDNIYLDNTLGVFKNPDLSKSTLIQDYDTKEVKPWYYKITIPNTENNNVLDLLKTKYKVKGYFFVRQKRIPITFCQGLSIGIDRTSYLPMLAKKDNLTWKYFTESFLNKNRILSDTWSGHVIDTEYKQCSGILSVEANTTHSIQSMLDGSEYVLQELYKEGDLKQDGRMFSVDYANKDLPNLDYKGTAIYVGSDIPMKYVNDFGYSTRAGSQEDVKQFSFFNVRNLDDGKNTNLVRGIYCPFIGVNQNLHNNTIYNIRLKNYSEVFLKDYFTIRGNDNSEFFSISDRYEIDDNNVHSIYRGDCFTSTTTIRMNRNFIDSEVPVCDIIVEPNTWKEHYNGYSDTDEEEWLEINKADINTVQLGHWVTFKCLTSRNIGLRSVDHSYTDEEALMGNPRSFYPYSSASTTTSQKIAESVMLNDGYNSTVNKKRNYIAPNVPYIKDIFDNRIMFSNVQQEDTFKNAYRIFQGMSYKDIDRQYGAIVKLIPWGVNLFCVFEHGLAIIPINEKALLQTSTEQNIHIYGSEVIQSQISIISQDFGSIWPESVIKTNYAIYGVDTYAKKIWKYTDKIGLVLLSDLKIQRFLNDNVSLKESDKYQIVALRNVKTHYNNYKGDVMFTFYNYSEDKEWNLCYNERQNLWVTKYSWTPLYSANINNVFYSLDKRRSEPLAYIYNNKNNENGLYVTGEANSNQWDIQNKTNFNINIDLQGYSLANKLNINIKSIRTSYLDSDNVEHFIMIDKKYFDQTSVDKVFNINYIDSQIVGDITIGTSVNIDWTYNSISNIFENDNIPTDVPLYYLIDIEAIPYVRVNDNTYTSTLKIWDTIGIISKYSNLESSVKKEWDKLLRNGFYVHGRAGIFDEINYEDENAENNITPTKWYDKQEDFEIEFVVNNLTGLHKIFNNLIIISNNVQPKSLEFEIVGDAYLFNKARLYNMQKNPDYNKKTLFNSGNWAGSTSVPSVKGFKNAYMKYDNVLNQYTIVTNQDCKNFEEYGRILGNIHYKEDSFYSNIEPMIYDQRLNNHTKDPKDFDYNDSALWKQDRLRDKWMKVRVKYSGKDLVVITAIKTLMTLSYS